MRSTNPGNIQEAVSRLHNPLSHVKKEREETKSAETKKRAFPRGLPPQYYSGSNLLNLLFGWEAVSQAEVSQADLAALEGSSGIDIFTRALLGLVHRVSAPVLRSTHGWRTWTSLFRIRPHQLRLGGKSRPDGKGLET